MDQEIIQASTPKIQGGHILHWVGAVFLPDVAVDRPVKMLRDYAHRAEYFRPEVLRCTLLCRTGQDQFGTSMTVQVGRAVLNIDSDVLWEHLDDDRWQCRSYSRQIKEHGGRDHGYLWHLDTFWKLTEMRTPMGTYVETENVSLIGVTGFKLWAGEKLGWSAKAFLEQTLRHISETLSNPNNTFVEPSQQQSPCPSRP